MRAKQAKGTALKVPLPQSGTFHAREARQRYGSEDAAPMERHLQSSG